MDTATSDAINSLRGPGGRELSPYVKEQLERYLSEPSKQQWTRIHGFLLSSFTTLWSFVRKVDPTFPKYGPRYEAGTYRLLRDWDRIPSPELVLEALKQAAGKTTAQLN